MFQNKILIQFVNLKESRHTSASSKMVSLKYSIMHVDLVSSNSERPSLQTKQDNLSSAVNLCNGICEQ